ncbi:MAG TPA: hypothetical protein EYO94_13215 [Acidobacteria bacterium]|nr:hypothetical protein [Acidobacteriota bacterium]HIM15127.1 hypothetical protein [Acidobacteriota bacterium]
MSLICADCGNKKSFQIKTIQITAIEVVEAGESPRFDPKDEGNVEPTVLELLCEECESSVDLDTLSAGDRQKLRLAIPF